MAKTITITQKTTIPATPAEVYEAYTNAEKHAEFTGSPATSTPKVRGDFTAWDSFIKGKYIRLEPGKLIVQEWTSSDFPEEATPSRLEIIFREVKDGTELFMTHSGVPEEAAEDIAQGWKDYYWEPMKKYFRRKS